MLQKIASKLIALTVVIGLGMLVTPLTSANGRNKGIEVYTATMKGYQEVPAVNTFATGYVTIQVDPAAETIAYKLSFDNLAGSVTQSHIHVGQPGVSGGVALWLCQTAASPAPAAVAAITPTCPDSGAVSGTLTADNVVGPTAQLIAVGEMDDVISAIRAGVAYANVHSTAVPGGEIRGQLR